MSSMCSNSRESACFKQSSRVRKGVISPPPAARLCCQLCDSCKPQLYFDEALVGPRSPPLVQILDDAKERYVSLQAQTRILTFRGNSSVAQRAAGIQASKQLSLILMRYCTCAPLSRVPASAYHSWYLAVATALSPRMAVSLPLMQINRQ
jgi:hypothetical protein